MKRTILSIAIAALAISLSAQTVNVHFKNGQTIVFPSGNVEFVDFSEKAPDPTVTAGAAVDLGLSVYWSSYNVGAEAPEEYGDYFAWGETKPKSKYDQDTYAYYDDNTKTYINIGEDIAGTEYDAATVNLGNDWRMPTNNELQELRDNCTWEWTQINNVNGYKVTAGNGNSIFIPAAGYKYLSSSISQNKNGWYSTGNNYEKSGGNGYAYTLKFSSSSITSGPYESDTKWYGYTIRPVTSNPNAGGDPIDHSNDYLVTDNISAAFTGGSISTINGVIRSGSVLNVKFNNASTEAVTLIGAEIHDSGNSAGNNMLSEEVEVAAGTSKSYSVTLGSNMVQPVICFTYRYNNKKYTAEATYSAN